MPVPVYSDIIMYTHNNILISVTRPSAQNSISHNHQYVNKIDHHYVLAAAV